MEQTGFPTGTKSLPVPSPLLGSLLQEIDDIAELKCTLRFLWYSAQVKGFPKPVAASVLESDSVLLNALGSPEAVREGLAAAQARGTLLAAGDRWLLNTPESARAVGQVESSAPVARAPLTAAAPAVRPARPNVYALYEDNVGMLTPMIADELRSAEEEYPEEWIEAAIRLAVEGNKRSWRYIAAILERWAAEGRGTREHGESGRHTETASAAEYLRRRRAAG
jgi:DNA replication protein